MITRIVQVLLWALSTFSLLQDQPLAVGIAHLDHAARGAVEQHFHFDRLVDLDGLGIVVEIAQVRVGADGKTKALVANLEVNNPVGANCAGCNPIVIHCVQLGRITRIARVSRTELRCCEAPIAIRVCIYLDKLVCTWQRPIEI
jgi:hypothetical protein